MTKHTIALSEPIAEYVDRRLADGHYASLSEYFADLVAKEMAEREVAVEQLRGLLDEAEESGVSERGLDEILAMARSGAKRAVR